MMAKKKSEPKSPFLGRWQIVSMSNWDEDYLNEEVPAFIEFEEKRKSEIHSVTSRASWTIARGSGMEARRRVVLGW